MIIAKFQVIESFFLIYQGSTTACKNQITGYSFLPKNIIAQCRSEKNVNLQLYKHDVLETLTCKCQEFLGNRHCLCQFPLKCNIHICTRFCCLFYNLHHLWLHHYCRPDHSQNSCHKQLELLILLVQESVVTS